jgi:hypothetical protein
MFKLKSLIQVEEIISDILNFHVQILLTNGKLRKILYTYVTS